MRVHINIQKEGLTIDRSFTADDAEGIVQQLQDDIAVQIGPPLSMLIRSLPATVFVKEIVAQINLGKRTGFPLPNSCDDFLDLVVEQGYAAYIPDE